MSENITVTDAIAIQTRTYFSLQHIQSAALFARASARIEQDFDEASLGDLIPDHRAYVTGTIFTAVAFLEALINEIFIDAHEGLPGPNREFDHLPPGVVKAIGARWDRQLDRSPILDKFLAALAAAQKPSLPKGRPPYENARLLIDLRDALIHYKPETITSSSQIPHLPVTVHAFERKLKSKKFALNPLMSRGNPFFPDKCLSHGCAKWAVTSSVRFADEFFAHLGIPATYEHIR